MVKFACAILAVVVATFSQVSAETISPPITVSFQLADGVRFRGQMTAWDDTGFEGSFGLRRWVDLMPDDTWDLHQRVMDTRSANQWVNLGRVLLFMPHETKRASVLAERAFRAALREDADSGPAIEAAREDAKLAAKSRREAEQARAASPLNTSHPEDTTWPANPWPTLNEDQIKGAILAMRTQAIKKLEQASVDLSPMETEHFLLYFDVPRPEAARSILVLERVRELLRKTLAIPPEMQTEWGRIAVFIVSKRKDFQKIEERAFRQLLPLATIGMTHCAGPQVFVVVERDADDDLFIETLIQQTVIGLMHHVRTPHRLPPWANVGLAEHVASLELRNSLVLKERRKVALNFIRDGGDVSAALDATYDNLTSTTARDVHAGLGRLLTELMIHDRPEHYAKWVMAVKAGSDWTEALSKAFGVSRANLVQTATQYYVVND